MDAVIADPEQVADVLEAAADYIDEHGWTQGAYANESDGRVCILGALVRINSRKQFGCRLILHRAVNGSIAEWNDAPGREQWEVDELLRTTAKKVRAGDITVGQ